MSHLLRENSGMAAGAVWKRSQDRAYHAEYAGNGRCRDDGSVCKCSGYKRRVGKVLTILRSFGEVEVVSEHLIDAVVSASGSSPAYVFMMIEAMADAAVADGMPRPQAYKFAAQAVMGSAKMVLETGKHPGELKDMVCSPAGTTIEAVQVLEERGFRSAIIEAMRVCAEKSRNM